MWGRRCYQLLDWNFWAFQIVGLRFPMACSPTSPVFTTWGYQLTRSALCFQYVSPMGVYTCVYPWVFPIAQFPMVYSPARLTTTDLGAPSMGRAHCASVDVVVLPAIPPHHSLEPLHLHILDAGTGYKVSAANVLRQ